MSKNCRRCVTDKTTLTAAEGEVRRLARVMVRATPSSRFKDQLTAAKANRTEARSRIEQGHECDTKLSDEHWTKARPSVRARATDPEQHAETPSNEVCA